MRDKRVIDDNKTNESTTWSSSKMNGLLDTLSHEVQSMKDDVSKLRRDVQELLEDIDSSTANMNAGTGNNVEVQQVDYPLNRIKPNTNHLVIGSCILKFEDGKLKKENEGLSGPFTEAEFRSSKRIRVRFHELLDRPTIHITGYGQSQFPHHWAVRDISTRYVDIVGMSPRAEVEELTGIKWSIGITMMGETK